MVAEGGPCLAFLGSQARSTAGPHQADTILISVQRMGGYGGTYEQFDIYADGRVTNAAGQVQHVPVPALEGIRRRAEVLDVPHICDIRASAGLCSDCFQYRIVFSGPSGMKRTFVFHGPMSGSDSVSKIARDVRDLVTGLKWK
jgi:hypothetical protein